MPNIIDILARAQSLMNETALNSITPPRAGGIMYDTLLVLNQMQLEGASLLISKVYASVSAMEADTTPTSDLTGRALKPGQLVVIVTSDTSSSDMGSEYRFNGPGSWTYVGKVGGLPLDTVPTENSTKGITSGGVYAAQAEIEEDLTQLEAKVGDGVVIETPVSVDYTRSGKKVPTSGDNRIIISNAGTDVVYYRVGFSTTFRVFGKCGTSATIITFSNGTGTGDSVSYTKYIEHTTDDFNYIGTTPADKDYVVLTVNNNGDAYGCFLRTDRFGYLEDSVQSIGDEVDELEKTFERTINGEKLTRLGNGYIDTNVGVGNVVTLTPSGTSDWGYYIAPIAPGQEVVITGKGGSGGRLWAFLDATDKLLDISESSLNAENLRIVAPADSAKLVANNNFVDVPAPSFVIYSSDSIQERLDLTEYDTLLKVGNNERQPGGNGYFNTNVGVGNAVPTSPSSTSSSWRYYIVPVAYGQRVILSGKGGGNSRLWAFVDKDNNLLSISDASLTAVNLSLDVPQNATKVIINNNYAGFPVGSVAVTDAGGNLLAPVYAKLPESRRVNILIIGNSFSYRSTGQTDASLGTLCVFAGLNAHIEIVGKSGASFDTLYGLFQNNTACEYHYESESNGVFTNLSGDGITIGDALEKLPWDYIVFHQASALSGDYSSFAPDLGNLIRTAKLLCPNEHLKIGLMETWAYADNNSTYPNATTGFDTQEEFYEAICETYSQAVRDYDIDVLIPAGTAIQNARGTSLGTSFNDFALSASDDVHINPAGCVLTSMAWFASIFGALFNIRLGDIPKFTSIYTDAEYAIALECAKNAIKFPFETTEILP